MEKYLNVVLIEIIDDCVLISEEVNVFNWGTLQGPLLKHWLIWALISRLDRDR